MKALASTDSLHAGQLPSFRTELAGVTRVSRAGANTRKVLAGVPGFGDTATEAPAVVWALLPPFARAWSEVACVSCTLFYVSLFPCRPEQNLLHPGHGGTDPGDDTYPRG